jgi:hypothetical protein
MAVPRNQIGHRASTQEDEAEAAEAVAQASLLMRILDQAEDGLAISGRRS